MIKWSDGYYVNSSVIDEDRRRITNIINMANAVIRFNNNIKGIKNVLEEMTIYAHRHFSTEENYMIEFNYPDYQNHKKEHYDFSIRTIVYLNRVINGDDQTTNEVLEYLQNWLVCHIQETGKKYIGYYKKMGLK
jgi:hemerythrin